MDPFRLCVAMTPLAAYLLMLAGFNFTRRPVVVSGTRDLAALGLGIVGLLVVGPIELLLPQLPSEITGYAWLVILLIYALSLTLGVLLLPPRIVVYNASLDQIRPVLSEVVNELDSDARWAGGSAALPNLRVEFHLDDHPSVRNVSLIASSSRQSFSGWRTLEKALRKRLRATVENAPNLCGLISLLAALAIAARMGWLFYFRSQDISQGFHEMLRF